LPRRETVASREYVDDFHAERVRDLYLIALSREPSERESEALVAYVEKRGKDVRSAYEDVIWVLINAKEFTFNH
jgi:hypothetical protein